MNREKTLGKFEDLKSYFQNKSDVEVDEEDIFILACALEQPLTIEEMCYSTGLKLSMCIAKVRKLMEAGLLNRYSPESPKGQKRGGLFVYQLTDNIACELGALRIEGR